MAVKPGLHFIFDARMPMRDGTELSADVYLPPTEDRHPAILQRTPYDNANPSLVASGGYFALHGYAFVAQDVRGRGDSDGRFVPNRNEAKDGFDTIEWIAHQPWCDGKVGMMGASYAGSTQWWAARETPPHLVTLVSTATSGKWVQDPQLIGKLRPYMFLWLHRVGGRTMQPPDPVVDGAHLINWRKVVLHRPYKDMDLALGRTNTIWREWLAHSADADYWSQDSPFHSFSRIKVPVLHITGWYDGSAWGELFSFERMIAESMVGDMQYLVVGPWDHAGTRVPKFMLGGLDFTQAALMDMNDLHLRWFDYWLKGIQNGQPNDPKVRIFTMGRNTWRNEKTWPLPNTRETAYYLHSKGRANTLAGDGQLDTSVPGDEPTDSYVYNPEDPTPSAPDLDAFLVSDSPLDHRYAERRDDVLVYTSELLEQGVEVTGTPYVRLYAASDAVDTDFAAMLTDVYPDGRSVMIGDGLLRASYRNPSKPSLITPGQVYEYKIELAPTSIAFLPGHRIRVAIMSAEFPAYDRNPNTGAAIGEDKEMRLAAQSVYHSSRSPSCIVLPVIPN